MSNEKKEAGPKTHDYTKIVNAAIKEHGSSFLKALTKAGELIQDFAYRPGKAFMKVGSNFVNGRAYPCYRKGIVRIRGEVNAHIDSLPKAEAAELAATVMQVLRTELEEGVDQRQVLLQSFNKKLQEEINDCVTKAGHDPFLFEQEYVNGGGFDSKVFVMMYYDEHFPSEERLEQIEASNIQRKNKRIMEEIGGKTASAVSADFATK